MPHWNSHSRDIIENIRRFYTNSLLGLCKLCFPPTYNILTCRQMLTNKLLLIFSWVWTTSDHIPFPQFVVVTRIGTIQSTSNLHIWQKRARKRYRTLLRCEVISGWNITGRSSSHHWGSILLTQWIVHWNYLGRSRERISHTCRHTSDEHLWQEKRLGMYTKVPFRGVSVVTSAMVMGTSFPLRSLWCSPLPLLES